jgi:hypothetical protein
MLSHGLGGGFVHRLLCMWCGLLYGGVLLWDCWGLRLV